ncbi:MAG: hypothetical protein NT004_05395 [Bacteroidetes bacterium]|nr:hypothetical protein [Bacteroidota bacterium]
MKNHPAIILFSALIILTSSCKKKSFDPMTKSQGDFIGTWTGTLTTFKNNKQMKETGNFLIFPEEGGTLLGGIIYLSETRVFRQFQFQNGTLYFKVFNTDPSSPVCQNWNLSGYASFIDEITMDIRISGNECGNPGSEYVDWSGTLVQSPATKDTLPCFTFAKATNNWTYQVIKKSGDTCQIQKLIAQKTGDYFFTGESTHSCGWTNQNIPLKWNLTPAEFLIQDDATISIHPISIPIYAKPGVVYKTNLNQDTVTLTLLYTDVVVTTAIGDFICNQYIYTEPVAAVQGKITRSAYLWLNFHNGIIQQLVVNPVNDPDIKMQILTAKNF